MMVAHGGDKETKKELSDERYPSLEVAEARIKQALLKYKVAVEKIMPVSEQEEKKVRL